MNLSDEVREIFREILMGGILMHDHNDYDTNLFFKSVGDNPSSVIAIGLESEDDEIFVQGLLEHAEFEDMVWDGWHYILSLEGFTEEQIERLNLYSNISIPLDDELIKEFKLRVEMELL